MNNLMKGYSLLRLWLVLWIIFRYYGILIMKNIYYCYFVEFGLRKLKVEMVLIFNERVIMYI